MLQSKVLETFSPILIPFSFLLGVNMIESSVMYQKFSMIGTILFTLSLGLFYDRIENSRDDTLLFIGFLLFGLGYFSLNYLPVFNQTAISLMLGGTVLLGYYIINDHDIYDYQNQYIYLSLLILFLYLAIIIPYNRSRNNMLLYMVIPLFFYTILVLSTIKIPFNTPLNSKE